MRIRQEKLADFIKNTLLNIRAGLNKALDEGLIVKLPKSVTFQVEVIQNQNVIGSSVKTTNAETTTESPIVQRTTEVTQSANSGEESNTTYQY